MGVTFVWSLSAAKTLFCFTPMISCIMMYVAPAVLRWERETRALSLAARLPPSPPPAATTRSREAADRRRQGQGRQGAPCFSAASLTSVCLAQPFTLAADRFPMGAVVYPLPVRAQGVHCHGLTEVNVASSDDVLEIIHRAQERRQVIIRPAPAYWDAAQPNSTHSPTQSNPCPNPWQPARPQRGTASIHPTRAPPNPA